MVGQTIRELNLTGAYTDRLQLDWIKAHCNHAGNERADELARSSVYVSNVFFDIQPPMSLFRKEISNCIQKEWTYDWQKNPMCRMTKKSPPIITTGSFKEPLISARDVARSSHS